MKLISITDFVLNQKQSESFNEKTFINEELISLENIRNYAKFLKQPLKLEMFINCDDEGNFFEEPKKTNYQVDVNTKCSGWKYLYDNNDKLIGYYDDRKWKEDFVKYKQSKEKVLFEGFEITDETEFLISKYGFSLYFNQIEDFNIEHLLTWSNEIQLTESAIKQIGLCCGLIKD